MAKPKLDTKLVDIIAKRIAEGEKNPLRGVVYTIEHVTNELYRPAIIEQLKDKYGIEV